MPPRSGPSWPSSPMPSAPRAREWDSTRLQSSVRPRELYYLWLLPGADRRGEFVRLPFDGPVDLGGHVRP
jgi:hypothetical protein